MSSATIIEKKSWLGQRLCSHDSVEEGSDGIFHHQTEVVRTHGLPVQVQSSRYQSFWQTCLQCGREKRVWKRVETEILASV